MVRDRDGEAVAVGVSRSCLTAHHLWQYIERGSSAVARTWFGFLKALAILLSARGGSHLTFNTASETNDCSEIPLQRSEPTMYPQQILEKTIRQLLQR